MPNPQIIVRQLSKIPTMSTSHNVGEKSVLLAGEETSSSITQIALTKLKRGEQAKTHVHPTMDEHFIFLKGEGTIVADDEVIACSKGTFVLIPAGSEHSLTAETDIEIITIGVSNELR